MSYNEDNVIHDSMRSWCDMQGPRFHGIRRILPYATYKRSVSKCIEGRGSGEVEVGHEANPKRRRYIKENKSPKKRRELSRLRFSTKKCLSLKQGCGYEGSFTCDREQESLCCLNSASEIVQQPGR